MDKAEYIRAELEKGGVSLSPVQAEKLAKFYDFLVEYNKNVNLTAVTEFEEAAAKHFADSIIPFADLDISSGERFIDIGTGAGFPSLPLLIYRGGSS